MAEDWSEIRKDYINGGGSQRKLAKKYGVSESTLMQVASREKWKEQRDRHISKIEAKTKQKTVEKTSDALSDEAAAKVRIRGKLLWLAEKWIDQILEDGGFDTGDFRRMVQSCADLGVAQERFENSNADAVQIIIDV